MSAIENKVVWITGASSGIGEALAYTFAKYKARIIISARREDELERVKKNCNLPKSDILLLPLDVSKYDELEAKAEEVIAKFGKVDILINNAGVSHWSKINDTSFDVIKKIMDVNFFGSVALTKVVLPGMLAQKQGTVVVVSSILGKMVTPKQSAYNSSKHALHGFFDTLRAEYQDKNIKVLLVCPGFVNTNVAKNSLDKNGNPINKNNNLIASGLDPLVVAEEVVKALRNNEEEIVVSGGKEKFALLVKRLAPGLFSKYIAGNKAV